MLKVTQTAAPDSKAPVVIVITEAALAPPHRECATRIQPMIEDSSYIQICVYDEASCVFPVVGKEQLADPMGCFRANEGRKSCVKDCVVDDGVTGAMVLVPTSFPVGNDRRRLVLSNQITDSKLCLVIYRNLSVRILEE